MSWKEIQELEDKILSRRQERKRLRELNTKDFGGLTVEHYPDGNFDITIDAGPDEYSVYMFKNDMPEFIEFLQRGYRFKSE